VITIVRTAAFLLLTLACRGAGAPASAGAAASADSAVPPATALAAPADTGDPLARRAKGSPSAPVTVYEMSDFQCPFCRRFALETFPAIEREYIETGKVRWVYVNFPLTSIHPNAVPAAEFAVCAAQGGRFWPAHDILYETQQAWARLDSVAPFLLALADSIGAPRDSMLACLQNPATRELVRQEALSSSRAGATSTPTFYIEGGLLAGAHPIGVFRQVLDSIYADRTRGGS
jgi:protein-disulfide isomerase